MAFLFGVLEMAKKSGSAYFAHSTEVQNEVIDTGDGVQTVFPATLSKAPVRIDSLTIEYTNSNGTFQATTDANGDLSGTDIVAGTLAEDGTFSTPIEISPAPTNGTDIVAITYISKGIQEQILDFVLGESFNEVIDTGDGVQVSFPVSLANTGISKGNLMIEYEIGGFKYRAFSDGQSGFNGDKIDPSTSLDYVTSTGTIVLTEPLDNGKDITAFYCVGQNGGEEGRDWLLFLKQNAKDSLQNDAYPGELLQECVIRNSSVNYEQNVFVGMREHKNVSSNIYGMNLNCYYDFNEVIADWNQNKTLHGKTTYDNTLEMWTTMPEFTIENDLMTYDLYSNKNRIVCVVRVSNSIDESFYIGSGKRMANPSNYPNPLIAAGSTKNGRSFTDTTVNHFFFISPTANSAMVVNDQNQYLDRNNYSMIPGNENTLFDGDGCNAVRGADPRPRLKYENWLFDEINDNTLFALDGVYWTPSTGLSTGDTFTEGGDTYKVYQNINRVGPNHYFAVKDE